MAEKSNQCAFLSYRPKHLKKINAIRRVISAPDAKLPPILNNGQVLFSSAEGADNEPRSCYNCPFYNYGHSCQLMEGIEPIKKLVFPKAPVPADSKQVEYWPVCGMWIHGEPNYASERYIASMDPDDMGLGYVNAPRVGLKYSGTSCGGQNGGDDCDYWMVDEPDKRAVKEGFCRVLQKNTKNGDCCSCWIDDDWVSWRTAKERFKINK